MSDDKGKGSDERDQAMGMRQFLQSCGRYGSLITIFR
jgi:hypothetical protein